MDPREAAQGRQSAYQLPRSDGRHACIPRTSL